MSYRVLEKAGNNWRENLEERAKEAAEEETKSPFEEIPDWFYSDEPISKEELENIDELFVYSGIQRYLGKNVSKNAIDKFLFGHGVNGVEVLNVQSIGSSQTQAKGELMLEARVKLPSGSEGTIRHILNQKEKKIKFDYIKPDKNDEKFPSGFGIKFFKAFIPLLREIGIQQIDIQASSVPSSGMNGAYTWCFFGFTNKNMKSTLQKYIDYLENYHNIYLDGKKINAIMKIKRMRKLLEQDKAEDFLKAKRRGNMEWDGIIRDVNDESSVEMDELIKYLRSEYK